MKPARGVTPPTKLASWVGLCLLGVNREGSWGGRERLLLLKPLKSLLGKEWVDFSGVGEPQLGLKPPKSLQGKGGQGQKWQEGEGTH